MANNVNLDAHGQELIRQYRELRPTLKQLSTQAYDQLCQALDEQGIYVTAMEHRVKTERSLAGKLERKGDLEGERLLVVGAKDVAHPLHLRYLHCSPWTGYIFNEVNLPLSAFHLDCEKE